MMYRLLFTILLILSYNTLYSQRLGIYSSPPYKSIPGSTIELMGNDSLMIVSPNLGMLDTTYGTYIVDKDIMTVKYLFYDFKLDVIACENKNETGLNLADFDCYPYDKINVNGKNMTMPLDSLFAPSYSYFISFYDYTKEKINNSEQLHIKYNCENVTFDEVIIIDPTKCYNLKLKFDVKSFDAKRLSKIIVKNRNTLILDGTIYKRIRHDR